MSLDKAIKHKKERRKQYYGAKAYDATCRNHGSCSFCRSNRQYQYLKYKYALDYELNDFLVEYYWRHMHNLCYLHNN